MSECQVSVVLLVGAYYDDGGPGVLVRDGGGSGSFTRDGGGTGVLEDGLWLAKA